MQVSLCGFSLPLYSPHCAHVACHTPVGQALPYLSPTHHHRSQPGPGEPLGLSTGCVPHTLWCSSSSQHGGSGAPLPLPSKSRRLPGGLLPLNRAISSYALSHPAKHRLPRGGPPSSPACWGCIDFASSAALQWRQRGRHDWPASFAGMLRARVPGRRVMSGEELS